MELSELIHSCIDNKRLVSIVGAGGKTTLMYRLATEAAAAGKKVLVTTTTHIMRPETNYAPDAKTAMKLWQQGCFAVIGKTDESDDSKLVFPNRQMYEELSKKADLIIVEADGAKKLPCKLPAAHEPVLLPESDLVIGVMGMTALGKPLKQCCFRYETEGAWLLEDASKSTVMLAERILDETIAVNILSSDKGTRQNVNDKDYVVVLNQCDNDEILKRAQVIAEQLKEQHGITAVCGSLLK